MKKKGFLRSAAVFAAAFALTAGLLPGGLFGEAPVVKAAEMAANTYTPVYRIYNPNTGEHFFTQSAAERDNCVAKGWNNEGIAWFAPVAVSSETTVWRNYNPNSGEHYWTLSFEETNMLITKHWNGEGPGFYSADSKTCNLNDRLPIYKVFNPNCPGTSPASHHYTTNAAEKDHLVSIGWRDEGIGWYACPDQSAYYKDSSAPPAGQKLTIEQDPAYISVEANIKLENTNASGTHGKVVIANLNGQAVASFGVQYEPNISKAYPQFPGNTVFLLENIQHSASLPGGVGKDYRYLQAAELGKEYKIRLSWTKADKKLHCYVNDQEISSPTDSGTTNANLSPIFTCGVEGSVAHNGDRINCTFTNIKTKIGDNTDGYGLGTEAEWNQTDYDFFGLDGKVINPGTDTSDPKYRNDKETFGYNASVTISGTATIDPKYDWDTSFQAVEPRTKTTGHPLSAQVVIPQDTSPD